MAYDERSTQYWTFNGKTYYTYSAWQTAVNAYNAAQAAAAYAAKQAATAAAQQAAKDAAAKSLAAAQQAQTAAQQRAVATQATRTESYTDAVSAAAAQAAARQRELMLARQRAELANAARLRMEADARRRAEALRQEQIRLLTQAQRGAAAAQQAQIAEQLKRVQSQRRAEIVAGIRTKAYVGLQKQVTRVRPPTNTLLDAIPISGRERSIDYARRAIAAREVDPNVRQTPRGRGPVTNIDRESVIDRRNRRMVEDARTRGDWSHVLDTLDDQSRKSGGRFTDEALYTAYQNEFVQPVIKVQEDFFSVMSEFLAAEAAGDTETMDRLAEENSELTEQFTRWYGDGLEPGEAAPIFARLSEIEKRRARIWLATVSGRNPDTMSEADLDELDARIENQINRPGRLGGGPDGTAARAQQLSFSHRVQQSNGEYKNEVEFGMSAYLARASAREQTLQREQFREAENLRARRIGLGYEQITRPDGTVAWRKKSVGEALSSVSDLLNMSEARFANKIEAIREEVNPAVQENDMKRLLNDIANAWLSDYRRENGDLDDRTIRGAADYTASTAAAKAAREAALHQYMSKIINGFQVDYGFQAESEGSFDYSGTYLPPILKALPSFGDPVNDVINRYTDWARPGTSQNADISLWNEKGHLRLWDDSGQTVLSNTITGRGTSPEVEAEYQRWLLNRDHPNGDIRSAANRRWREVTLTGNVSFLADVVLDPLNAAGLLAKPFTAFNLARKAGMAGAASRTGSYLLPQFWGSAQRAARATAERPARWTDALNYHHVRQDQVRVAIGREYGVAARDALNWSDDKWTEFLNARQLGEKAIGETALGAELLTRYGVNRSHLMSVINERVPILLNRHGVFSESPFDVAQRMVGVKKSTDFARMSSSVAADARSAIDNNLDDLTALRNERLRVGDAAGQKVVQDARYAADAAANRLRRAEDAIADVARRNEGRGAALRRARGIPDDLQARLEQIDQDLADMTGGNPHAARSLQDRIDRVELSIRQYSVSGRSTEKLEATLTSLNDELVRLPGIKQRRAWHAANRERRRLRSMIEPTRRSQRIFAHFNTAARIKQMRGGLADTAARVKSGWGQRRGAVLGRGLYLSGEDSIWSSIKSDTATGFLTGGKGRGKGGGVNRSSRVAGAPALDVVTGSKRVNLKPAYYKLNTGARVPMVRNVTELRAMFKRYGVKWTGKSDSLVDLTDAMKAAGDADGISMVGVVRWGKRSPQGEEFRRALLADQVLIFDPKKSGAWIEDTAAPLIDDASLIAKRDEIAADLEVKRAALREAEANYAPNRLKVEQDKAGAMSAGNVTKHRRRQAEADKLGYQKIVDDLTESTREYTALVKTANVNLAIVNNAPELLKIRGPSGIGALRTAQVKLKEAIAEMARFEDQIVYGSAPVKTVEVIGDVRTTTIVDGARTTKIVEGTATDVLGRKVKTSVTSETVSASPVKEGIVSRHLRQLAEYHQKVGGDPYAPSYVDNTFANIRKDRIFLNDRARSLEKDLINARSPQQKALIQRSLDNVIRAQRGLILETRSLDRNRGVARAFARENLAAIRPAIRPQRIAAVVRNADDITFARSEGLNDALYNIVDVVDDPKYTPEIQDFVKRITSVLEDRKASSIMAKKGGENVSRTLGLVRQLERHIGKGELSLLDAWRILEDAIRDPVQRAAWSRAHVMVRRRVRDLAEKNGWEGSTDQLLAFIRKQHTVSGHRVVSYDDIVHQDNLYAAAIREIHGYRAKGQIRLKGKAPSRARPAARDPSYRDTDPRIIAAKLRIGRETGMSMDVYDNLRPHFSQMIVRANREQELIPQAAALPGNYNDNFKAIRALRAEEEAVRNWEEFATRKEHIGIPHPLLLHMFREINVLNDVGKMPGIQVNSYVHSVLNKAWEDITGFAYSDAAKRSAWLQGKMSEVVDPAWKLAVQKAKTNLLIDTKNRMANAVEHLRVRALNRKAFEEALPVMRRDPVASVGVPVPRKSGVMPMGVVFKNDLDQLWNEPVVVEVSHARPPEDFEFLSVEEIGPTTTDRISVPDTTPGMLYHGTPFSNSDSFIDASGNLHIRGSDDAGRKRVPWRDHDDSARGVFMSPYPKNAASFKQGVTSPGSEQGGFLFEIDAAVFVDGSLYRNPRWDSRRALGDSQRFDNWDGEGGVVNDDGTVNFDGIDLDEIIYRDDLVVPKGSFRVFAKDLGEPVDVAQLIGWTDITSKWSVDFLRQRVSRGFLGFEETDDWLFRIRAGSSPETDKASVAFEYLNRLKDSAFLKVERDRWNALYAENQTYLDTVNALRASKRPVSAFDTALEAQLYNLPIQNQIDDLFNNRAAGIGWPIPDWDTLIRELNFTLQSGTVRPVDVGEIGRLVPTGQKQPFKVISPRLEPVLTSVERSQKQVLINSAAQTVPYSRWADDPPPLDRRDLMREWFVRNGRWDPETGEAIRQGRRVWSVDEERSLYSRVFGHEPIWTDRDWLRVVLRDQRAYQRGYRMVGFVDNDFEALADGDNLSGVVLRHKGLQDALVWGKEGFSSQRTLDELRDWARQRYGDLVVNKNGDFISMPWLMKMDRPSIEYLPWLRHALSPEGREEFRLRLEEIRPRMGEYLESQYYDDVGGLRPMGLDIDPTMLGAKGEAQLHEQLNGLAEALYEATERRIARMKHEDAFTSGEWLSQEVMTFGYDVMNQVSTSNSWRGLFRGRTLLQQALHVAGWQRALISYNPAFGVMNLAESYGYKRGLLTMAYNGWAPLSVTGRKYAHRIKTVEDFGDSGVGRLFGREDGLGLGARALNSDLPTGERLKAALNDVSSIGIRASEMGERQLRLDFGRVMYGKAYESMRLGGMSDELADRFGKAFAAKMNRQFFASIGDDPIMGALNQLVPFLSYRFKQMTLAVRMSVEHPWIPLTLGKIQDEIIKRNRDIWIEKTGSEVGFDPNDQRNHSFWIWTDDMEEPYRLDVSDVSDWTRATKAVIRSATEGSSITSLISDFVRIPHPLQQGIWAALTGGTTPWGKPGDWRETFWFIDAIQWLSGHDYENPKWQRDGIQFLSQMLFFKGFGKLTQYDMMAMTFYAMLESGDKDAAYAYLDAHPELTDYWDSTRPFRSPRWDPLAGRPDSAYRDLGRDGQAEFDAAKAQWELLKATNDAEIFKYAAEPWSDEYRAAKQTARARSAEFLESNPILMQVWGANMSKEAFADHQEDWIVDGMVDTWFSILDNRPEQGDYATELEYTTAQVEFNTFKQAWLDAHPAVSRRLYESNRELLDAFFDQEQHWSETLDFLSRVNLRILNEEEKGSSADADLIDMLYRVKGMSSLSLDAETYTQAYAPVTPGTSVKDKLTRWRIETVARVFGSEARRPYLQIPGFADYRYGNASPQEQQVMREDAKYYDELGVLAEQIKLHRDEEFSDDNDWWGQLEKRGLLDRYLSENPHKRFDYDFVVAIGNIVTNYGQNFWSGMMLPDNKWILDEYLARNPDKQGQYEFMRGLDHIWNTIGMDFTRFYSELAKNPWLEAEYFRRNPEKAGRGANSAYGQAIGEIVNAATSGKDFYDRLRANPWVEAEYFRRHPEKKAQVAANEAYIAALSPWVEALKRNDFVASQRAWDAMEDWVKERYFQNNPDSGMRDGAGGSAPTSFSSPESQSRFIAGQEYYATLGGWIALLEKKDYIAADNYFRAMPVWMKEKYWAKHPDQRAKMELDSSMLRAGAEYFLATGADKDKIMADNPELMRWLQEHGGSEAEHRGLIIAIYRAIPSKEAWLKRTFREKYPEIFSHEASGQRRLGKIALDLAENPDKIPFFEKSLKLQYDLYREQLKLKGASPKPWAMERVKRVKKNRKRRAAAFNAHWRKKQALSA